MYYSLYNVRTKKKKKGLPCSFIRSKVFYYSTSKKIILHNRFCPIQFIRFYFYTLLWCNSLSRNLALIFNSGGLFPIANFASQISSYRRGGGGRGNGNIHARTVSVIADFYIFVVIQLKLIVDAWHFYRILSLAAPSRRGTVL